MNPGAMKGVEVEVGLSDKPVVQGVDRGRRRRYVVRQDERDVQMQHRDERHLIRVVGPRFRAPCRHETASFVV